MKVLSIFLRVILTLCVVLPAHGVITVSAEAPPYQVPSPELQAKTMLSNMSPEEKVGQLFLITFKGTDVDQDSLIYDLIVRHHVGGVVLTADNNNFVPEPDTTNAAYTMISQLQEHEWNGTLLKDEDPVTGVMYSPQYIPLFVAISQEGDLYPFDQIYSGLTAMPNQMAIGATWDVNLAEKAGAVIGKELSSLGFNLYFGPSLDVLDILHTDTSDDLGTRTFGGDPFWVGEMGKYLIKGIHTGSNNRLATIAKHFPGRGSSDRLPEVEVATVRKSLEQLKQIELAPFYSVTGMTDDASMATDGLLVSHIRYQGFQGNIRVSTKPMSFDQNALEQLLQLPEIAAWRTNKGIIVSDDLGSQAVRMFFDPVMRTFDARQVARDAFLAGNDLLYMDNFVASGDPDQYTTILRTLDFFSQKYREDSAFAQRVDMSVERLLTLKYSLYSNFSYSLVKPSIENLLELGNSASTAFEIIKSSATLISPSQDELINSIPQPPRISDRIVFITDTSTYQQCDQCVIKPSFAVDAFHNSVLKLYGPSASEQVMSYRLSSYTFKELVNYLNQEEDTGTIENDLRDANWLVFSLLNVQNDRPESLALHRLLSERPDLLQNKKVVCFSFNAPYYLDATDISKLSAYYGLFSKIPAAVDVATRLLFQEIVPTGALPVSVPGIGYDLIEMTSPDPAQVIKLRLDIENYQEGLSSTLEPGLATLPPAEIPTFDVGDNIPLVTDVILDHNQNMVPDGTNVRFNFRTSGETETSQQVETFTKNGVARTVYRITNPGTLEISVRSEPANTSDLLRLNIVGGMQAAITVIAPTQAVTPTLEPTATQFIPTPTSEPVPVVEVPKGPTGMDWLLTMSLIWLISAGIYWMGGRIYSIRWGVRWALLSAAGGIIAYIILAGGFLGSDSLIEQAGLAGLVMMILAGNLSGLLAGYIWRQTSA